MSFGRRRLPCRGLIGWVRGTIEFQLLDAIGGFLGLPIGSVAEASPGQVDLPHFAGKITMLCRSNWVSDSIKSPQQHHLGNPNDSL